MSRQTAASTVKTRILIISDTHSAPLTSHDAEATQHQPFRQPLPPADVLIHCGDLTIEGGLDEYNAALDMMARIDAPVKIAIAGNHDRTLDRKWVVDNPHRLRTSLEERLEEHERAGSLWYDQDGRARREGVVLLMDEGVHEVPLKNGAIMTVYANPYTPEFCRWAYAYELNEDRFNPPASSLSDAKNIAVSPVPSSEERNLDIIITHGPPYARLDRTFRGQEVGCPHLLRALMRSRPLLHCFGHIHEGWGAERITWDENATKVGTEGMGMEEWKGEGWRRGVGKCVPAVESIDRDRVCADRCVRVDLAGPEAFERGRETLLVNAAIMDVEYKPVNAPWLVEVDLPVVEKGEH